MQVSSPCLARYLTTLLEFTTIGMMSRAEAHSYRRTSNNPGNPIILRILVQTKERPNQCSVRLWYAGGRTISVNLVRLIHLSPPPEALVNHILAPAVRQVYRKRCPTVS